MVITRPAIGLVFSLLVLPTFPVAAQEPAPVPEIAAEARNDDLRLRGRGIVRYEIRDEEKFGGWNDEVDLNRARFDARWQPTKGLRLLLEIELTQGVEIRDAFARYKVNRYLRLKAGHFKKPFSLLRMTSRWDLLIPRRGLIDQHTIGSSLFGGFGGRDAGVMFFGRVGKRKGVRVHYWVGMFDGWRLTDAFFRDPDDPDDENTSHRDYVARVQVGLFNKVFLGVSYNHKRSRMALAPGVEMDRTFNAVSGDLLVSMAGFRLHAEGIYASNPNAAQDHYLTGGHGTISYRIKISDALALTPAFMAEFLDPDDRVEEKHALRLAGALNLDIGKYTRIILAAEGGDGEMVWIQPEFLTWDESLSVESAPRKVETRIYLQLNVRL
jgi:hypothetical protein